ncbi:MBL fold metallo-hydrolase [Kitasatospora cineracea]|uniref:L-ascorbate metabolism protein UlaG (Beta-lactamase superfamily) n=1 Tax=Kitasatospora cineracea TaxID=88074 RepID=A0A3N4RA50_9ACTN|nr:MBL fold metallo-hydrolase [Kitasatospora cineracea]ROR35306.1 L-ascorbate metabolism protein UlaG (beta-lactamase superfamily) [Kitasatospora cineracea]RPE29556.1 L-ascorbate metabolism protein UlaG (beta-lactamase superfamily) [Kitasatospora cineracea]
MRAYLSPATVVQPLVHRWYAVPFVAAPHTGALNLVKRHLPALRGYLKNPQQHARALADPSMFGAPFIDPGPAGPQGVADLLERTLAAGEARIRLAEDIDTMRATLAKNGDGRALAPLYQDLPPSLRGTTELVYDTANNAGLRFFESLLYRTPATEPHAQTVSLLERHDQAQPFVYSSPVLPAPGRTDLQVPFASELLDELFAARLRPVDVEELAAKFGLDEDARAGFRRLFTEQEPRRYAPNRTGGVRMQYFGHASVLLDHDGFTVLTDPTLGYDGDGFEGHFTIADLPETIDVVVLSHGHSDHFSLETLLQLRRRIGTIVVPRSSGGSLADIGLRSMLEHFGFRNVVELADMQSLQAGPATITALPFLGEHGELDIRAKMVPMVRLGGRGFLFATDTSPIDPTLYDLVAREIGTVDALFIGLECVGAPLTWLYGPLLDTPISREHSLERGLKGSFAEPADQLAQRLGAQQIFVYALGIEPWLKHLTGCWFDPEAEQLRQEVILRDLAGQRGVRSELLYLTAERSWPTAPQH